MVVGQQINPRVGFIIQARMKSTRLPGKVLLPLPLNGDKPIIKWIVDSVRNSKFNHNVILATSIDKENDPLSNYCYQNNIECYRGSEDNVLSRFIDIIESNQFDLVVRLTGDNPFVDIHTLDNVIEHHCEVGNDYTYTFGLPLGMNFEIINKKCLLALKHEKLTEAEAEHVTLYIRSKMACKKEILPLLENDDLKDLRLTVDYPSDLTLVNTIASFFGPFVSLAEIRKIKNLYPWIFESNKDNIQR
jgi:spore coat polysaccharide biosynthesis protein SpsF